MHALRQIHRALVPGGILLDMHPVPPSTRAEVGGVSLGDFEDEEFFDIVRATERPLAETELFVLDREIEFDYLERYNSAEELLVDVGEWEGCRVPTALADAIREAKPPVDIWERVVLRRFCALTCRHNCCMATCAACGAELPNEARFCPTCGASVEARPATEERKLATVLFADLVGSTELGEQDPERTRALLDRFYDAMAAEIEGAGGTVEKFIGDAVMAAFGAPLAHEDHAERALHAALSMQRRLAELFGAQLALRIGINTGEVVVGRPREGSSFVTGDAVNVAQRLEASASAGQILVGERTASAVRGAFEFGERQTIQAKGKSHEVECRPLVRALSLMRPRGIQGLRRAFVARETELELLQATFRRTVDRGEPHLVALVGDAGVGKTRLVRELWEWLGEQTPEPLRRTGRCLPYGQGITYWALGEMLKEHLGILESDPPETVLRRLQGREILGLTIGVRSDEDLHPLTARDRLHEAWLGFLDELTQERPTVLVIEDLHAAEPDLLELFSRVHRDLRGPLMLIGTGRPEFLDTQSAWGQTRNSSLVWLEPLGEGAAGHMLEQLLSAELPAGLRDVVVERSEGNPFFVEELLGSLIDRGVLERVNGGWQAHPLPEGFEIPDSVQAVIASRIDLLSPREKAGLQAAAVIGRVFWPGPVRDILDGEEADFDLLEDKDFVRRRPGSSITGEREYAIKHALTREVAYGSLPKARRAHLHARFADWLEQLGEAREDLASVVAHHYAQAVRPEDVDLAWVGRDSDADRLRAKAVRWLSRAAELAVGRYEIDEGVELLTGALALERDGSKQAELWREIGRAHALKFEGEPFWTAMQESITVCYDRRICAETYAELALQTVCRSGMWKRRPEPELVQGWIAQALEMADAESPARAKALLARAFWGSPEAAPAAAEASTIAERLDDPELRSLAWAARAGVALGAGDYDTALTWAQRPFELVQDLADPDLRADVHFNAILPSIALGRFREARRLAAQHDAIASTLTTHHRVHGVAVLLEVEEHLGGWERVAELEARVEEDVEANLDTPCIRNARTLYLCALARLHLGDEDGAKRLEQRADDVSLEGYGLVLDVPRIRLALLRGDLKSVATLLLADPRPADRTFSLVSTAAKLDGFAALGMRVRVEAEAEPVLKPGTYLEPFALRALGLVRQDEGLLRRALERFEAMRLDWHAQQTRFLLAG